MEQIPMDDGLNYSPETRLRLSLATWIVQLHGAGVQVEHPGLVELCLALQSATDATQGDAAANALVDQIGTMLGDGVRGPDGVAAFALALYGQRLGTDMGTGTRAERTARIRRYQFGRRLPWMARIWERGPDGTVSPHWLIVESVTDEVTAMDLNPWNDIDEERAVPVGDFHVLWELDGCTAMHVI